MWVLSSFEPERIITLVFKANTLKLQFVKGENQLWKSLLYATLGSEMPDALTKNAEFNFDPQAIIKLNEKVDLQRAPLSFHSWEQFLVMARKAASCESANARDGVSYRHKVWGYKENMDVLWNNPTIENHPEQNTLVQTYFQCLALVGIEGARHNDVKDKQ